MRHFMDDATLRHRGFCPTASAFIIAAVHLGPVSNTSSDGATHQEAIEGLEALG
jgi:hypothetical protein